MSVESAIYSHLSGVVAVTALVSTRIYPNVAPQGVTLPYIVQQRVSRRGFPNLAGSSGMVRQRHQLDCFATTQASIDTIVTALRTALDGWRNTAMGTESLNVLSITLEDARDSYQAPSDGSDIGVHRASLDFIVLYGETIPSPT